MTTKTEHSAPRATADRKAPPEVAIAGLGLFCPGYDGLRGWLSREPLPSPQVAAGELLDKRSRRRASLQTKAIADAYGEALAASSLDATLVGSVVGSALGEASTMLGLLDQMFGPEGMLSPMRFATSVHNAAAGVISIATHNQGFTTSVGADHDTPAMALLEGICFVLTHEQPVIVVCGDEAAPDGLVQDDQGWDTLAVAVALVPLSLATDAQLRLGVPELGSASLPAAEMTSRLANNPSSGLLDLVEHAARGREGTVRLDRGLGRGYVAALRPASAKPVALQKGAAER